MLKRTIFTMLIMLFSVVLVSADGVDDQGNPNDPHVNDRANACYEGGAMEGNCDTLWEWICGWHVIRLEPQDEASRAAFPPGCVSLLPAYINYVAPVSAPSLPGLPSGGCVQWHRYPFSVDFAGAYFIDGPYPGRASTNCFGGGRRIYPYDAVYAPAPFDALTLCNLNGIYSSTSPEMNDMYRCNR